MTVNLEQNIKALAGINLKYDLIEVTQEGKINKVTALGYLWRAIQSFLGIGKGFSDCKLDLVASKLNAMIDGNFADFCQLEAPTKQKVADTLKRLSGKAIKKHREASGQLTNLAGLVDQAVCFAVINSAEQIRARHALQKAHLGQSLEGVGRKFIIQALASAVANGHFDAAKNLARELLKEGMPDSRNLQQMLLIVALEGGDGDLKKSILKDLRESLVEMSTDLGRVTSEENGLDGGEGLGGLSDPLAPPGWRASSLGKALMRAIDHHLRVNGGNLGELASIVKMKDSDYGICFNEAVYDALLADCPHLADHVFQQMPDNFRKARVIADVLFLDKTLAAKEKMFSWVEGGGDKQEIAQEVLATMRGNRREFREDHEEVARLRRAAGEIPS